MIKNSAHLRDHLFQYDHANLRCADRSAGSGSHTSRQIGEMDCSVYAAAHHHRVVVAYPDCYDATRRVLNLIWRPCKYPALWLFGLADDLWVQAVLYLQLLLKGYPK